MTSERTELPHGITPQAPDGFTRHVDIRDLNEHGLEAYLEEIVGIEDGKFPSGNGRQHKLGFLLGGAHNDTTTAKTSDGEWVMSRKAVDGTERNPKLPRAPEILEAVVMMSQYFDRVEEGYYDEKPEERFTDQVKNLSEISDVAFNIFALILKDPPYKDVYRNILKTLSISLGYETNRELLLMSLAKYSSRYVTQGRKDHTIEDSLIADLLWSRDETAPRVEMPTDEGFGNSYRWLNLITNSYLAPRLVQIAIEEGDLGDIAAMNIQMS